MSAQWEYLVKLYCCGVRGTVPPVPPEGTDWQALLLLADRQTVSPVISYALRKANGCGCPRELLQPFRMTALEKAVQNRARQEAALDCLQRLRNAGLSSAVLKGMSLACYYAAPETRSCADTDILISPQQEQEAAKLFVQLGFSVRPRLTDQHHFQATHRAAGLFEVHIRLWGDETALAYGSGDYTLNPADLPTASLYGKSFPVLPQTDALLQLCLHLMKHFARQQAGLRTAFDVALFFAENREQIQTKLLWRELKRRNADVYVCTVLSIFVRAGCFREADFPGMTLQSETLCALLSEDMEQYSSRTEELSYVKSETWLNYSHAQAENMGGSVRKNYKKRRRELRRSVLLPNVREMSVRYPALKKSRLLYPLFWIHRSVSGILSKQRRKSLQLLHLSEKKPSFAAKSDSRAALLQKLGLFQEKNKKENYFL